MERKLKIKIEQMRNLTWEHLRKALQGERFFGESPCHHLRLAKEARVFRKQLETP